ncbi:Eukaryotic translation initiation factor 4 gamma 2, partial [Cichlidogyrus casuarinus]
MVLWILNKVTAENFTQQTQRILNVGIDSPKVLQIIVNLLFIKATDEPKFTSLYAQICSKLVASSPNFEPLGSSNSTFRILLLKRCEDEFRARTELKDASSVVRARCLGNLRFIGELGRLNLMPEKILYDCVRELLSSKSRCLSLSHQQGYDNSSQARHEYETDALAADMECMCQFLTTVGQHIDTPKAKNLMDQFFDRLKRILARAKPEAKNEANHVPLPSRVRFMIDDLLDLRDNNWVPRRAGQRGEVNKPRYLRDIRVEVAFESGTVLAPTRSERAENQRDVPGSGYVPPALAKARAGMMMAPGLDPERWMELNRMGEALCRRGNGFDLMMTSLGGNGPPPSNGNTRTPRYNAQPRKNHQNGNEDSNGHRQKQAKFDEGVWTRGNNVEGKSTLSSVIGINPEMLNSSFEPTYLRKKTESDDPIPKPAKKEHSLSTSSSVASDSMPGSPTLDLKQTAKAMIAVLLSSTPALNVLIESLQEIVPLTQLNEELLTQLFLLMVTDQCGLNCANRSDCVCLWGSVLTRARQESFLAPRDVLTAKLVATWRLLVKDDEAAPLRLREESLVEMFKASGVNITQMLPQGSQAPKKIVQILEDRGLLSLVPELRHLGDYEKLISSCMDGDGQYSLDCVMDFVTSNKVDLNRQIVIQCLVGSVLEQALKFEGRESWKAFWGATRQLAKHSFMGHDERQRNALLALRIQSQEKGLQREQVQNLLKAMVGQGLVEKNVLIKWLKETSPLQEID